LTDADLEAIMVQLRSREMERPPIPRSGSLRAIIWGWPAQIYIVAIQEEMPPGPLCAPVFARMVP